MYDKRQTFALGNGNEERTIEYISWRGRFGSDEKASYSVLAKEDFESRFEAGLRERTANIKDEIELNGKR